MKLSYDHPLQIKSPAETVAISSVKHGVTEIALSDGRIIRLSIHVEGLKPATDHVNVAYGVITEMVTAPEFPIAEVHEVIQ